MRRISLSTINVAIFASIWCGLTFFVRPAMAAEVVTPRSSDAATDSEISGRPGWRCARTKNFRVVCEARSGDAADVAKHCEKLRVALRQYWFPNQQHDDWSLPCEIVVHSSAASYQHAVGRGIASTAGSADVKFADDRVLARRIDLRGDRPQLLSAALPHEMTHVVMADWTRGKNLPLWADEGMAMLADSPEKQARHAADLSAALNGRSVYDAAEILNMEGYPAQDRWPAFYAQSHALVKYLVQRDSPERFVQFLATAQETGYDAALREHYRIDGARALRPQLRKISPHGQRSVVGGLFQQSGAAKVDVLRASFLATVN